MITAILLELEPALELEKWKNSVKHKYSMVKRVLNNNNYQYPSRDKEIIDKLSDLDYKVGNYILPENASIEDKFKYEICQTILTYQQEIKISYEKLTQQLDLPFAKTMSVLKKRIKNFTLKELVRVNSFVLFLQKYTRPRIKLSLGFFLANSV
jgi:hypothetical protein